MPLITIASVTIPNWQRDSDVELRLFADASFSAQSGDLIVQGDPSENAEKSDNFFVRAACTLSGTSLTIASVQLDSTLDSDVPSCHWQAWFFTPDGVRIGAFGEFQRFVLPASPTSTTWAAIAAAQQGPTL